MTEASDGKLLVCFQANFKLARQYYASALQLSDGRSPRALYGVTAVTAALAAGGQKVRWSTCMTAVVAG